MIVLLIWLWTSVALAQGASVTVPVFTEGSTVRMTSRFFDFDNRPSTPAVFAYQVDDADSNDPILPPATVTTGLTPVYQVKFPTAISTLPPRMESRRFRVSTRWVSSDGDQGTKEGFFIVKEQKHIP